MELYTQNSQDRQDLIPVADAVNPPEGYIGARLLPTEKVRMPTGTIYYATVTADGTAQTARSVGVAPTGTQIAQSTTTFTSAEVIDRGLIAPNQVEIMGGIANADKIGATFAVRSVMKKKEANIASALLAGTASAAFDPAKLLQQIQVAKNSTRRFSGRRALYGSHTTFVRICQQLLNSDKMSALFSRVVAGTSPQVAIEGMSEKAQMEGLRVLLGVDEILPGDDDVWNATAYDGKFGLSVLPDPSIEFGYMLKPEIGRYFQYIPDQGQQYRIETYGNLDTKNNQYDAIIQAQEKVLNSSAFYIFNGVAA